MIITLTRTGGFTGIPFKKSIDTSLLPKEKAEEIEKVMGNVSEKIGETHETNRADRFWYTFSVQDGEKVQEVKMSETSLTPQLKATITYIQNL